MSQGLASWCIPRNNKSRASSRDALLDRACGGRNEKHAKRDNYKCDCEVEDSPLYARRNAPLNGSDLRNPWTNIHTKYRLHLTTIHFDFRKSFSKRCDYPCWELLLYVMSLCALVSFVCVSLDLVRKPVRNRCGGSGVNHTLMPHCKKIRLVTRLVTNKWLVADLRG